MESSDQFFNAFSEYLLTEDPTSLLPYLQSDANPAYLKIYRNGAIKSALNALSSNFPTVKQLLGDDTFNTVARNYVQQQWPSNGSLSHYGELFPAFMRNFPTLIPQDSADFAQLDRAWLDVLFAQDENHLQGDELMRLIQGEPDQLPRLTLVKSARIVNLSSQCLSEWIKLKFGTSELLEEPNSNWVLLWRLEGVVHYRPLSQFEATFINAVAQSGSIMGGAEAALAIFPAGDISSLFSNIISAGILAKYSPSKESVTE